MRLMDLLREELIVPRLHAGTRDEALSELVQVLVDAGEISGASRDEVLGAVAHRERSHTTGLGSGVAVPHGLCDCVNDVVAALGVVPAGVDFKAIDDEPSRIIILLVVPRNRFQAHVRTLAGIARLLNDHVLRERLVAAATSGEIMDVIVGQEEARSSR